METSTLADRVYEILKGKILQHEYAHGEKLNIAALADELNVSNTPVREAISRLEKVRLVEIIPYRGPFVRSLTPTDAAGVYDVRIVLEALAARLAAANVEEADVELLQRIHEEFADCLDADDLDQAVEVDVRFHEAIASASRNATLISLLEMLADWTRLLMQFGLPTPRPVAQVLQEHDRILDAVQNQSYEEASAAMRQHIIATRNDLIAHLAEYHNEIENAQLRDHPNVWQLPTPA